MQIRNVSHVKAVPSVGLGGGGSGGSPPEPVPPPEALFDIGVDTGVIVDLKGNYTLTNNGLTVVDGFIHTGGLTHAILDATANALNVHAASTILGWARFDGVPASPWQSITKGSDPNTPLADYTLRETRCGGNKNYGYSTNIANSNDPLLTMQMTLKTENEVFSPTDWFFWAFVNDGALGFTLYINGVPVPMAETDEGYTIPPASLGEPWVVGIRYLDLITVMSPLFQDRIRFIDSVLTQDQLISLYTAELAAHPTP